MGAARGGGGGVGAHGPKNGRWRWPPKRKTTLGEKKDVPARFYNLPSFTS